MADYFHSALRGDQLHEAKIKILPAGSPMPTPEWEGQFVAIGLNLYYSVRQNNTLVWIQPTAFNQPTLPSNTVTFETGTQNPPTPRTTGKTSGIIYLNNNTQDIWYLNGGQWIKLGANSSASNFEIIPNRPAENWQGNYFGLLNPSVAGEENCLLVKKWQANKKYYLAIKSPTVSSLGGADTNSFFLELWRNFSQLTIAEIPQNSATFLTFLDTTLFTSAFTEFRLGMFLRRNDTKLYLNFTFDFDARFLDIKSFANISYGY